MDGMRLEHVIIRVDDLDTAIQDYRALGFAVVPGGVHGSGFTHNALIHFLDGSFLELIAFRRRLILIALAKLGLLDLLLKNTDNHVKYRFTSAIGFPEGFIDSALLTGNIAADIRQANERGLRTTKAVPFERQKPGGEMVRWNIMSPFADALPFVRDAYAPAQPVGADDTSHENGALGIARVHYVVRDLAAAKRDYEHLLGNEIALTAGEGKQRAEFELDGTTIALLPAAEDPELNAVLDEKRECPVEVTLRTGEKASIGQLPEEQSHRARIILARG